MPANDRLEGNPARPSGHALIATSNNDTNGSFRTESQSFLTRARLKLNDLVPRIADVDRALVRFGDLGGQLGTCATTTQRTSASRQ